MKLSNLEWALLETLCVLFYKEKLVPFQMCAAWDSGFKGGGGSSDFVKCS